MTTKSILLNRTALLAALELQAHLKAGGQRAQELGVKHQSELLALQEEVQAACSVPIAVINSEHNIEIIQGFGELNMQFAEHGHVYLIMDDEADDEEGDDEAAGEEAETQLH